MSTDPNFPGEDAFSRLPWARQNALIRPFLIERLSSADYIVDTRTLSDWLAQDTGLPSKRIATILIKRFAPHATFASHDGALAHTFGHETRGWRWHPVKPSDIHEASAPPAELGLEEKLLMLEARVARLEHEIGVRSEDLSDII